MSTLSGTTRPEGHRYYRRVPMARPAMYTGASGPGTPSTGPSPLMTPREVSQGPIPTLHHARQLVTLNVGGKRFVTLYETLARFRSPYFERIVTVHSASGKICRYDENIITDENGSIFINRDGSLFTHVLQYMRDGKNVVLPENRSLLKQIRREADFFGLGGLREAVEDALREEEEKREEREETLQNLKATVSSISQSLYVTNFARRG